MRAIDGARLLYGYIYNIYNIYLALHTHCGISLQFNSFERVVLAQAEVKLAPGGPAAELKFAPMQPPKARWEI